MTKKPDIDPVERLLLMQTHIVQQLGLYLHNSQYIPSSKELNLLDDIAARASDAIDVCRYLEHEFFRRMRNRA